MYERVIAWFYSTPWAIEPGMLAVMESLLRAHATGWRPSAEDVALASGARRERQPARPSGAVAVIGVHGVIAQHADLFTESSGGTSTESLTRAVRTALADPEIGAILMDIDSPGGSVFGLQELADEMYAANRQKPVVAVANASAASAAYWLASQAGDLSVTPSGEVGSIGVLAAHEDISGLQSKLGVQTSLISAGRYKDEGTPFTPLTDDARNALQARVDAYYATFTRQVARGRHTTVEAVRTGFGEGRMVGAVDAVRMGMADRVETLDQALARVSARLATGEWPSRASAETWLPPLLAADDPLLDALAARDVPDGDDADVTPDTLLDVAAAQDGGSPTLPLLLRRRLALRARAARA